MTALGPISPVGYGTWAAGGADRILGWGPQDDDTTLATMTRAVQSGVTWFDTAAIYGVGHAEELCGQFLRQCSPAERPLVFTKCGRVPNPDVSGPKVIPDLSADGIRRQVDDSLRRLGVDSLDGLFVHWPPTGPEPALTSYWRVMAELREEGLVRWIGLSNHDADQLARAHDVASIDLVQLPFSPVRRDIARTALPWCQERDVPLLAYSPMQSGLLTGRFSTQRANALPQSDWRRTHPDFIEPRVSKILPIAEAMRAVATRHQVAVSAVAISWVLAWPGVTAAIVGGRSPGQVDDWSQAGDVGLDDADLSVIAAALHAAGLGDQPVQPPR